MDNQEITQENIQDNSQLDNSTNETPVYSQMSLDYVAKQVSDAKRKGRWQGALIVLICVSMVAGSFFVYSVVRRIRNGSIYASIAGAGRETILDKDATNKVNSVYRIMKNLYIDEIDKSVVEDGILAGMLDSLDDPYTVYYTEEEYKEMMEDSSGVFEGIGAYLQQDPDTMVITVVRPIKESPAEAVGILAGDYLVEVDGEDISGQDLNVVVAKVRGEKGTHVDIGVRREGEPDIIHYDVVRASVNAESVESEMYDGNIGYIYITEFADATGRQFNKAYDELLEQGMEYLILDLRSNGGGYVDTSIEVASRMVEDGVIVSLKDRNGNGNSYKDNDDRSMDIPCVVLVDGNTASASEILTGALRDYNIATIIGTNTFGKGIVQDVIPLDDGSGIKITTAKYYTPNGENIHGIGIEPDILVEWDYDLYKEQGIDNQLEAAKQYVVSHTIDDKYKAKNNKSDDN